MARRRRKSRAQQPPASHHPSKPQIGTLNPWLLGIVLLGVFYQLASIVQFSGSVFFGNPILDARYQIEWAFALANGNDPHSAFFQSPLYSYFMAGIFKIIGWHVWSYVFIQWMLVQVTLILFYLTLTHFKVKPAVRLILFGAAQFYPLFPVYAAMLHKTTFEIFWHMLVLFLAVKLLAERDTKPSLPLALLFGLTCGFAALVRSTFQIFAVLICFLIKKPRLPQAALILIGFAGPCLWAVHHNYQGSGEISSIQTSFGFTLYLSNNPYNPWGANQFIPGISNNPLREESSSKAFAEKALGRELTGGEVSSFYVEKVREFIQSKPKQFFTTLWNKVYWYVHREELPDNEFYLGLIQDTPLLFHNPLNWGLICLLILPALGAIVCSWFHNRKLPRDQLFLVLFALGLMGMLIIFYVSSRLRAGHVLPWAVVIGVGLSTFLQGFETKKTRWKAMHSVLFATLCIPGLIMLFQKPLRYEPDMHTLKLCWMYNDLNKFDQATKTALKLKDPQKQVLMLRKIEELSNHPDPVGRHRHLLSPMIPHRR